MHSALKHKGKRLYQLAHEGIVVEREPRPVTIHRFDVLHAEGDRMEVEILCSKGTYVRTLAEDLGTVLGCGASVAALRRVGAGPFAAGDMMDLATIESLASEGPGALDASLRPMEAAVSQWPRVQLPEGVAFYLRKGQPVLVPHSPTEGWVRIHSERAGFIGVGEVLDDGPNRAAPSLRFPVTENSPFFKGLNTLSGFIRNLVRWALSRLECATFARRPESMPLSAVQKSEVVEEHKRGDRDTGSPEVQVALLSRRIGHLTEHFRAALSRFPLPPGIC